MKRILLPLALLLASLTVFAAIDSKFNEEKYEFKSLESNTSDDEQFLSLLNDSSVVFIKGGKVYVGVIDTAVTAINEIAESKELTGLGIHGTLASDKNNKKIYFSLKESDTKEWLYESVYDGKSWSKPKRLEIEGLGKTRGRSYFLANAGWNYIHDPKIVMTNPTIAKDGKRIYFTSADIDGGKGGKDIWWIEPKDDKVWKYPVNAGATVNSEADEDFAFVEKDEILYITSKKDSAVSNLFKADADGDTWSITEKMDAPYNTSNEDFNIIVKDGTPFLISNRGGNNDIWAWNKLPEPEPEPEEPEPVIPEIEPIVITFPWAFYLFDYDKANLTERFLQEIDAMVEAMAQLPAGTKFIIEGHTDQRGSDAYNDKLSLKRANTVRDKLIEKGVNPDILVAKGYGKRRPVIANPQNEEEFYQNRRVVVDILKDGEE